MARQGEQNVPSAAKARRRHLLAEKTCPHNAAGVCPFSISVPNPAVDPHIRDHVLVQLLQRLGLGPDRVDSDQAFLHKELLDLRDGHVLLLRSEWQESRTLTLDLHLEHACTRAYDLSTGEPFAVDTSERPAWHRLTLPLHCRQSRYLLLQA